jgi:SAM-dependent methyltransferase
LNERHSVEHEEVVIVNGDAGAVAAAADFDHSPDSFGTWMTRSEQSPACARLCTMAYGLPLVKFNAADCEQLDKLIDWLDAKPGSRVLDLGCGPGAQTEYISDRTGAHVTGIDFAPLAVRKASERAASKRDRLEFLVGDLNGLDLTVGPFDAAVAFDSLYFAEDLGKTVGDIMRLLFPGGRLFAFYAAYSKDQVDPADFEPCRTQFGLALASRGLGFETVDFTANDHRVWQRVLRCAQEMKDDFRAEDNLDLCWAYIEEAEEVLRCIDTGRARRYLYMVAAA